MYGAYDMVETFTAFGSRIGRKIAGWVGAVVLGTTPDRDPGAFVDASPVAHVDPSDAATPFLVVHGTVDNLVPVEQARRFADQLREVGCDVTYVELQGAPHAFDVFHSSWQHASATGIEWWLSSVVPVTTPQPLTEPPVRGPGGDRPSPAPSRSGAGAESETPMTRATPPRTSSTSPSTSIGPIVPFWARPGLACD
jgi:hypothetical protein